MKREAQMQIQKISKCYCVRRLDEHEVDAVFALYQTNPKYFDAMHDIPTLESVKADLTALPHKKTTEDKFYLGLYEGETLIAIMDLILAYPNNQTAFIGLFMVDGAWQGKGIGSLIIEQALGYIKRLGFTSCRLGFVETNLQSKAFWEKNGFLPTGALRRQERCTIVLMEKSL